jgi:hypothetical protein
MTGADCVLVALRVKATPERAFDVFTEEIALWWRRSLAALAERHRSTPERSSSLAAPPTEVPAGTSIQRE